MMRAMLAAMAILAAAPAWAQQGSEGAEAFVRAVYATYGDDGDGAMGDAALDLFWRPETARLIRQDRERPTDDPPYLDADPLCRCQDWEELRVTEVRISQFPGEVGLVRRADVRIANGGQGVHVVLRLRGGPGRWRIEDVISDNASLVESLTRHIEFTKKIREGGGWGTRTRT